MKILCKELIEQIIHTNRVVLGEYSEAKLIRSFPRDAYLRVLNTRICSEIFRELVVGGAFAHIFLHVA